MSELDAEVMENPLRQEQFEAEPSYTNPRAQRWVFCAKVPVDDEPDRSRRSHPLSSSLRPAMVATPNSAAKKSSKTSSTGASAPAAVQVGDGIDSMGQGLSKADAAEQQSDELAAANASLADARARASRMEAKLASLRTKAANDLRRVSTRAQENAAALRECRNQLRDTDEELGKTQLNLWSEQSEKSRLAKELAKMQGQVDAARMQSTAAHEAQVLLAKALNDNMDNLDHEIEAETALQSRVKALDAQTTEMQARLESASVQLRQKEASLQDVTQRAELEKSKRDAYIQKLRSELADIKAKYDCMSKLKDSGAKASTAQIDSLLTVRKQLEKENADWREKSGTLQGQLLQAKMLLAVEMDAASDLRKQREAVRVDLTKQLETAVKETEQLDRQAAKALLDNSDRTIEAKMGQIKALQSQVAGLKEQLSTQKQLDCVQKDMIEKNKVALTGAQERESKLNEQLAQAQSAVADNKSEVDRLRQQSETNDGLLAQEIAKSKAAADAAAQQLADAQSRTEMAESNVKQLQTEATATDKVISQLQRQMDEVRSENSGLAGSVAATERRAKLQAAAMEVQREGKDAKLVMLTAAEQATTASLDKLSADYSKLLNLYKQSDAALLQKMKEIKTLQEAHMELEKAKAGLQNDLKTTTKDLAAKNTALNTSLKEIIQKLSDSGAELRDVKGQLQDQIAMTEQAAAQIFVLESELSSATQNNVALNERLSQWESRFQQNEAARLRGVSRIGELENSLLETTTERDRLQSEAKRNAETQRQERTRAHILQALHASLEAELAEQRAEQAAGQAVEASEQLRLYNDAKSRIGSLEAELSSEKAARKAEADAAASAAAEALATAAAEKQQLGGKIAACEKALDMEKKTLALARRSAADKDSKLEALASSLETLIAEKEGLENEIAGKIDTHGKSMEDLQKQLEWKSLTIQQMIKDAGEMEQSKTLLERRISNLAVEKRELTERLSEVNELAGRRQEQLTNVSSTMRKYRLHAVGRAIASESQAAGIREQLRVDHEQLEVQLQAAKTETATVEAELSRTKNTISELEELVADGRVGAARLTEQLNAAKADVATWRSKARHRHRHLQVPDKTLKDKKKTAQWLKEQELDEALGFDEDNDHKVTVTFDTDAALGLGLLNCKGHKKKLQTMIHSIREGSPADNQPLITVGQTITAINDKPVEGMAVHDVVEMMHSLSRPLTFNLEPGTLDMKLLAFDDSHGLVKGKAKKKSGKGKKK